MLVRRYEEPNGMREHKGVDADNLSPLQVQEISIDYTNCNTTAPRQDSTNFDPTAENQLESIPSSRVSSRSSGRTEVTR